MEPWRIPVLKWAAEETKEITSGQEGRRKT